MSNSLKNKVVDLYNKGFSYNQIQKQLGCSKGTISYHCSSFVKKEQKFSSDKVKIYQEFYNKSGNLKLTALHFNLSRKQLAKYIDKTQHLKIPKNIKINNYYRKMKLQAIEYKGGMCQKCGYNKSSWALDFHHRNPEEKDFNISGGTKSFDSIKSELDKCDLLCRNCHSEEHEKLYNLTSRSLVRFQ